MLMYYTCKRPISPVLEKTSFVIEMRMRAAQPTIVDSIHWESRRTPQSTILHGWEMDSNQSNKLSKPCGTLNCQNQFQASIVR